MENMIIISVVIVLFLVSIFTFLVKRYKRCPSDRILVVFGKIGGKKATAKCVHGGAAFVIPIIQDYQYLDLTPIPIEVGLENALSRQNIRVNVPSRFMVGISTEEAVMGNAAERLLGLTQSEIRHLAADIIFGQLRVVIATMDIEEINADREKFLTNVSASVEHELRKIGLKLINVNVTDITDNDGYIEALGKEATAHAVNDAKRSVAEKNRDGEIGKANAEREQRIQIAAANAKAVNGENQAKIDIAKSNAQRREQEALATKIAVSAEKINQAQALGEAYEAERLAEIKRAEREKATQQANIIVPAEIQKEKIKIDASAEAEKVKIEARGEADALLMSLKANAEGNLEILAKQGEGFKKLVDAASGNAREAVLMMIADKLPELVKTQVDAIKNISIDKVTVWENGNSEGGTSTANFMKGMMGAVPPLEDLFKLAGMELPSYLKGNQQTQNNNINVSEAQVVEVDATKE